MSQLVPPGSSARSRVTIIGADSHFTWGRFGVRADQVYVRYDTLFGDPMTGDVIRAPSAGYLRYVGEHTRIGFNYQWKNRPTFNDDAVNTRFQTSLGIVF